MNTKKKKYNNVILLLLLLIVGISVGYAALSTTLNINGQSTIKTQKWEVKFDNVDGISKSEGATVTTAPTIQDDTTQLNYNITLAKPGDYYEFTVDVKNAGTIDAKLSGTPALTGVSADQQKYVDYKIVWSDTSVAPTSGDTITATQSKTVKVRVEYKKDIENTDLPGEDQSLTLNYQMTFVQA